MMPLRLVAVLLLTIALAGCGGGPGVRTEVLSLDQGAVADSMAFAGTLAAFASQPDSARVAARDGAEKIAKSWHKFEAEAKDVARSELDHWFYRDDPPQYGSLGFGLGNTILALKEATDLDPSFAEGWAAMGALSSQIGDLLSAEKYLSHAQAAALAAEKPLDSNILLQIYRDRAWALRDLTRWGEGLEIVRQGLEQYPGDPDLLLVKGLLLADAGRYSEAVSLAVRMKPQEYPRYDFIYRGLKMQKSAYANNWIRAMALFAVGDVDLAYHKLGDLDLYAYRARVPHSARFWRDAALLAELVDDPKAPLYYAVGFVTRPYKNFYPAGANNVSPQVLDIPSARLPVFTSFGPRFYIGGSPFAYVGLQINLMVDAMGSQQGAQAAGRALQMLDLMEKRHIRPDVCHALRGRIYFANDDFALARREMVLAQTSFMKSGRTDAVTALLQGLLDLRDKHYPAAETHFRQSVAADSTSALTWRSLAVACVKQDKKSSAEQAMDRAVTLDPWNISGLYNRGLFRLQSGKLGPATADLQRALSLDPENREVQRLRDMVLAAAHQAGADSATIQAVTMGTPLDDAMSPAQSLDRLQAEVDAMFTLPDSLRVSDAEADRRIEILMSRYVRDRDPVTRAVLALALIDHRKFVEAQSLLAPGWGIDLNSDEELMLLYVDHQIGERNRVEQVIHEVIGSGPGHENPYHAIMAANEMRSSTNPQAFDVRDRKTHGFFGFTSEARQVVPTIKVRPQVILDIELYRLYASDPMMDQAVWGMSQTPVTGTSYGPGTGSAGGK